MLEIIQVGLRLRALARFVQHLGYRVHRIFNKKADIVGIRAHRGSSMGDLRHERAYAPAFSLLYRDRESWK